MDISNFTKKQGDFLKSNIVNENQNALFEIIGESEVVHNEKFDTDRLFVPVKLGEKEYTFDCSRTNARAIEEKLGSDTSKWKGKHLVLETYRTKTSDGKMTDAINVKEVK